MDEREKNINGNDGDEYDKVCYVCRRPESKAGKMITLPGGIDICRDCMQKAFDTVMNSGFDMSRLSGITPEQLWNAGMPMGMWQNIPGKSRSAGTGNAGENKAEDQAEGGLPENGEKKDTAPKTPGTPDILGDRPIALCREITKKHEEILRGSISEIIKVAGDLKGEMVIVVSGNNNVIEETVFEQTIVEHVDEYVSKGMTVKDAIKEVAKLRNIKKNEVYATYHQKDE